MERFNVAALDEVSRVKTRERFRDSVKALQADRDERLVPAQQDGVVAVDGDRRVTRAWPAQTGHPRRNDLRALSAPVQNLHPGGVGHPRSVRAQIGQERL